MVSSAFWGKVLLGSGRLMLRNHGLVVLDLPRARLTNPYQVDSVPCKYVLQIEIGLFVAFWRNFGYVQPLQWGLDRITIFITGTNHVIHGSQGGTTP
jgi:hypothetical protein